MVSFRSLLLLSGRAAIEKLRRKNVKSRANIEVLEQGLAAEYANLSERRARVVDLQGVRDLNREVLPRGWDEVGVCVGGFLVPR